MENNVEKQELLTDIKNKEQQLREAQNYLKKLNEQYSALEDFSKQCEKRIGAFDNSMRRRKNKLLQLDNILTKVKSARRYKDGMHDLLYGSEYTGAVNAISNLELSVSNKKRSIKREIQDTEDRITRLNNQVRKLHQTYDAFPEEGSEND